MVTIFIFKFSIINFPNDLYLVPNVWLIYSKQVRNGLSAPDQNMPELLEVTFHSIRHWKGTTLYHETKDILYVKEFLGHKRIENTMKYINIERAIYAQHDDQKFYTEVARNVREARELIEEGWEYVHDKDGVSIYRKRK